MKRFLILLSALLLTRPGAGQIPEGSISQAVDAFVTRKMTELHIPGLAVAVVRRGKVLKKTAYGLANLEWQNKMTTHSCFQLASATKLLTSTLLLKALYEQRISLDAPLVRYLDTIPDSWQGLRVEHLLAHTSGLPDYYNATAQLPMSKAVGILKNMPVLFAAGTRERYAQSDFVVLAYLLEKVYRKPFAQLLHDEVTGPLGMRDGAFDMEANQAGCLLRTRIIPQKVTTYYRAEQQQYAYQFLYPQFAYAAGGYFASIDDMASWAVGLDQERLFPAAFAEPYLYHGAASGAGLSEFSRAGWMLGTEGRVVYAGHSGGPGLSDVWRFPQEGYTIITLTNDGSLLPDFSRAIAAFYVEGLAYRNAISTLRRD